MIYKNKSKLIKHIEKSIKNQKLNKNSEFRIDIGDSEKIQSSIIDFRFNFYEIIKDIKDLIDNETKYSLNCNKVIFNNEVYFRNIELKGFNNSNSSIDIISNINDNDLHINQLFLTDINIQGIISIKNVKANMVDFKGSIINGGILFYSMWKGYLENYEMKQFINFMKEKEVKIIKLHTSGHADVKTIDALIKKTEPEYIIPIHTGNAKWFERYSGCKIIHDYQYNFW